MGLSITQEQKQIITVAMKQSLAVLSMPLQNLQSYLNEMSAENPLIELDETYGRAPQEYQTAAQVENDFNGAAFETWRAPARQSSSASEEPYEPANHTAAPESFKEHLLRQLDQDAALPASYLPAVHFLVESLNSRGYLDDPIDVLADVMGISVDDAMQALYVVQSLSPTGVGARDLQECLILQLAESRDFNAATLGIVKNCLPLLAKRQYHAIARKLHLSDSEAQHWCDVVCALNPIPSRGFYAPDDNRYIVPDAYVTQENGALRVQYNSAMLPKVNLNHEYCAMLSESQDPGSQTYLRQALSQAKKVQKDLENRESTLVRVITCVLTAQQAYLTGAEKNPAILTINDVASRLELHPSTVSRAVKDKYIVFDGRTFPLKALFHTPVSETVSVSRPAVKKHLKYLIDTEDKTHPLSDECLKKQMAAAGIDISRRTIAAYREEMEIPCASMRRSAG